MLDNSVDAKRFPVPDWQDAPNGQAQVGGLVSAAA